MGAKITHTHKNEFLQHFSRTHIFQLLYYRLTKVTYKHAHSGHHSQLGVLTRVRDMPNMIIQ